MTGWVACRARSCSGRSMAPSRTRYTLAGSTHPIDHRPRRSACASGQGLTASADHVLKHLAIQRQIGDQLLELGVLVLELLQPTHFVRQQTVVLLLPIEV